MSRYLDELIARYLNGEIDGDAVCDNITRLTNKEEYILDVNENRTKEKIRSRYDYIRFSKSAEDVVIGWEEDEKILHFLDWIHSVLDEKDWDIFSQYTLVKGMTRAKLAESMGVTRQTVDSRLKTICKKIHQAIPYYNEQFGDLQEYLRG